jgi:hypothetical protein
MVHPSATLMQVMPPAPVPGKNKEVSMHMFVILIYIGVGNAKLFTYSVYGYE